MLRHHEWHFVVCDAGDHSEVVCLAMLALANSWLVGNAGLSNEGGRRNGEA